MLWHGITYSTHPLACAAGLVTLDVYEEDHLIENAAEVGRYLVVPPLCITPAQIDEGLAIIERALEISDKQVVA